MKWVGGAGVELGGAGMEWEGVEGVGGVKWNGGEFVAARRRTQEAADAHSQRRS